MSPWAVRDKDGALAIYGGHEGRHGLIRNNGRWEEETVEQDSLEWSNDFGPDPLPELTWNDEPAPVEISVKRKEAYKPQ